MTYVDNLMKGANHGKNGRTTISDAIQRHLERSSQKLFSWLGLAPGLSKKVSIANLLWTYFKYFFWCFHCWRWTSKCIILRCKLFISKYVYFFHFKAKFTLIKRFSNWENTINGTLKFSEKHLDMRFRKRKKTIKYCEKCVIPKSYCLVIYNILSKKHASMLIM